MTNAPGPSPRGKGENVGETEGDGVHDAAPPGGGLPPPVERNDDAIDPKAWPDGGGVGGGEIESGSGVKSLDKEMIR